MYCDCRMGELQKKHLIFAIVLVVGGIVVVLLTNSFADLEHYQVSNTGLH